MAKKIKENKNALMCIPIFKDKKSFRQKLGLVRPETVICSELTKGNE